MSTIILFVSSTVLIGAFLVLKRFELYRGFRFFDVPRNKLDMRVEESTLYVTHILPKKTVYHVVGFGTNATHIVTLMLLHGLRTIEHKLLGVSNAVKGRKEIHHKKASNAYLEDVSNHKRQIVRDRQNGDLGS